MAEPADNICIVTSSLATGMGTSLSYSDAFSGLPSLLQDVLNLFPRVCIRVLPDNAMKSNGNSVI